MGEDEFRDLESRILYEDNHILVFNKRPGEIVQADKTGDECLAETLKAFIAQEMTSRARCMWEFRIALTGLSVV